MSYTKTIWVSGQAPAITAANLNKIEQGIEDAHNMLGGNTPRFKRIITTNGQSQANLPTIALGDNVAGSTSLEYRITLPTDWKVGTRFYPYFSFYPSKDITRIAANPSIDIGNGAILEASVSEGRKVDYPAQITVSMLSNSHANTMVDGTVIHTYDLTSNRFIEDSSLYAMISAEGSGFGFDKNDIVEIQLFKPSLVPNPTFANGAWYADLSLVIFNYGIIYEVEGVGDNNKY